MLLHAQPYVGQGQQHEHLAREIVIGKGQARDQHPGQQLSQVAYHDEGRPAVTVPEGKDGVGDDGQQARPAEDGVQEGAESALGRAVGEVLEVVEYGPGVHQPLVPAGGVGVSAHEVGVVFPHVDLVVPDDVEVVAREVHAHAAFEPARRAVVIVARVVYGQRYGDEENKAESAVGEEA